MKSKRVIAASFKNNQYDIFMYERLKDKKRTRNQSDEIKNALEFYWKYKDTNIQIQEEVKKEETKEIDDNLKNAALDLFDL